MPIPTNIRRFSRSKEPESVENDNDNAVLPTEQPEGLLSTPEPKKRRGRPKKAITPVMEEPEPEAESFQFDDSFLNELRKENEEMEIEKPLTPPTSPKAPPSSPKALLKSTKRKTKASDYFDYSMPDVNPSFFSEKGSQLMGKEKRELLMRIAQYKKLFKNELKDFKIKKDASVDELKQYLDELDVLVSLSSLENFIMDAVLQAIIVLEGVSANTNKFDISGTAELLKQNPQFISLSKQVMLKYGSILKVPPETQITMLIISTMYLQMTRNRKKKEIAYFLDKPAN